MSNDKPDPEQLAELAARIRGTKRHAMMVNVAQRMLRETTNAAFRAEVLPQFLAEALVREAIAIGRKAGFPDREIANFLITSANQLRDGTHRG